MTLWSESADCVVGGVMEYSEIVYSSRGFCIIIHFNCCLMQPLSIKSPGTPPFSPSSPELPPSSLLTAPGIVQSRFTFLPALRHHLSSRNSVCVCVIPILSSDAGGLVKLVDHPGSCWLRQYCRLALLIRVGNSIHCPVSNTGL